MLGTYLWSGERDFEFPMLELGSLKYLPALRFGLTPFGGEYHLDNFLVADKSVYSVEFRYGVPTFHTFWGVGVKAENVFRAEDFSISAAAHMWKQPSLFLGGDNITSTNSGFGGAATVTVTYDLVDKP